MSNPRKHHYVPQFYLSGFAIDSAARRLIVTNKVTGKCYPSTITDTACERDFYLIEVEDEGDPFAVEKLFSTVETDGAEAIRFITERVAVPEGLLYQKLISFLAALSVRVPAAVDAIDKPFEQVMKSMLWQATASKSTFDQMIEQLKSEGQDISGVTYESMRDFVRSDDYTVTMGQNFRISTLLDCLRTVEPLLAARKWTIVMPAEHSPDFICSDRPVTLSWNRADLVHPLFPPGFGVANTTVTVPLSRRFGLLGLFETKSSPRELDARDVGVVNMSSAIHATRFIYSGADDFSVNIGNGTLTGRDGLLAALRQAAEKD